MPFKYNNLSGRIMAVATMVLGIIIVLASFNLASWQWAVMPLLWLVFGSLLISETGIASYLSGSMPRKFGAMDFLRIIGGLFGGLVIGGALLLIPIIGGAVPDSITTFYGVYGGIVGGFGTLLALIFLLI